MAMKSYPADKIRNIALCGHSHAGKTALAEAALYVTKAITRMGLTEEGNTVADFDPEEVRRGVSISAAVIPVEYGGHKINLIDAPGYADFQGELSAALQAVEMGLVVVDSVSGVEVGTEIAWQALDRAGLPRAVVINRMDRDNARWERVLEELRATFDARFVPLQLPIGTAGAFSGIYRLIGQTASMGPEGKPGDVPAEILAQAETLREAIVEAAAESDDELLMKFFDGVALTPDEIRHGLVEGAKRGKYVPVFFTAATKALGVDALLNSLLTVCPAPTDVPARTAVAVQGGAEVPVSCDPAGPLVAQVFKTVADQFVGKLQYVRVYSGKLSPDARVHNATSGEEERISQLSTVRGKEQTPAPAVGAGDIGAVAKLQHTHTFDTLCDKDKPLRLPPAALPQPLYPVAVSPVTKSDGAKLGQALTRLCEEDPSLRYEFEPATHQMVLSGMGDAHIAVAVHHLKDKFGVEVATEIPRVPYRETVTRSATSQYRHKKQTGGAGQFAEVHLRVEPRESGEGFEYASEVVGGTISGPFIASIEKGIVQILSEGVIANCPVVDVRAVVYDGKEHPVDSKDIAFQIAGRGAFKEAFLGAGPSLLEPIYALEIVVPSDQMGDVMGDMNTRRGMVQGTEQVGNRAVVKAQAPLAEIQRYSTDLRSMTQGRGYYTAEFSHYARVPHNVAEAVMAAAAKAKAEHGED